MHASRLRRAAAALAATVAGCALGASVAASAQATTYRASISGTQEVSWAVSGTDGSCEIRQGTGSGKVAFSFSSKPKGVASILPGGGSVMSLPATAKGTISGSFVDSVATPCEGSVPAPPVTEEADGCGATSFDLRVDAQLRGRTLFVTGPNMGGGNIGTECPFPVGGRFDSDNDRSACGEGSQLWQRSAGVSSAEGAGLLASAVTLKASALKRPTIRLTKTQTVSCTITSRYSGGVTLTGKLRYVITLKRLS